MISCENNAFISSPRNTGSPKTGAVWLDFGGSPEHAEQDGERGTRSWQGILTEDANDFYLSF